MAIVNEGDGRYKTNIAEVCKRINAYKAAHPDHVIVALTNPYNRLVVKLYDDTIGGISESLIMVVEYLTDKTIDQVVACADEHKDGRYW